MMPTHAAAQTSAARSASRSTPRSAQTSAQAIVKGARITGSARTDLAADLKKRYEKGESIRALAAATGRSYGFVHRLLVDDNVALRRRGGATRGKRKG
jgi:hypothetical protein